jgi:hypothetical protein
LRKKVNSTNFYQRIFSNFIPTKFLESHPFFNSGLL